jgi:hypothetical protein
VGEGVQVGLPVFAAAWAGPIVVVELVGDCEFNGSSGTETTADGVIDRTEVGICPKISDTVLRMLGMVYWRFRIDSDLSKRTKYW